MTAPTDPDDHRTRINAVLSKHYPQTGYQDELTDWCQCGMPRDHVADAVIAELGQEWRADFGYDGYAECDTRDEAKAQVDEFNAALGDDIRDGENAIIMRRWVTDWETTNE